MGAFMLYFAMQSPAPRDIRPNDPLNQIAKGAAFRERQLVAATIVLPRPTIAKCNLATSLLSFKSYMYA